MITKNLSSSESYIVEKDLYIPNVEENNMSSRQRLTLCIIPYRVWTINFFSFKRFSL